LEKINIYKNIALSQVPRILGFGDRDKRSKTFGCFDRMYWHYRLIDISDARFQEVSLLLALLYSNVFEGNIYYKNSNLLDWIEGIIQFWGKHRNKDGSVNELYPNERSYCSTAFSTYSVCESLLTLERQTPVDLTKTARFLAKRKNPGVSNQDAAAALALYNISKLTGDSSYYDASCDKIYSLISRQQEGYYPEYGGYDIGYQTITISLLVGYYNKTKNEELLESIKKAIKFVEDKVSDNGTFDYSNCSRKTQFIYPYGFGVFKSSVLEKHIKGLEENKALNPLWMDDRYCLQLTTDYLETYLEVKNAND